jgi:2-polyprenyl-3-methyl-5-hydroxy-6-metoxy-1,4-benzoquinol methylase
MRSDEDSPGGNSARPAPQLLDSADPWRVNGYDSFAEVYSAENGVNIHNAYYERPATLSLAGDVAGRRILDAGCGSGPLFAALRDRGAIVAGFDKSAAMPTTGQPTSGLIRSLLPAATATCWRTGTGRYPR